MNRELFVMVDEEYAKYISEHPDMEDRWLLEQTAYTAQERRGLYAFLPLHEGVRVLDVGTGFGALATELAAFAPIAVTGVDVSVQKLDIARAIAQAVVTRRLAMATDGQSGDRAVPEFIEGDAYRLPFADEAFDLVISRFLFQHLPEPLIAMKEFFRVVRRGGMVCVIDVDEGLSIGYPETNAEMVLHRVFRALQEVRGGDRMVGRKLGFYLQEAGFATIHSVAQLQSGYSESMREDGLVQFALRKLQDAREEIIRMGLLSADEYDAYYAEYADGMEGWRFATNGQITAFGVKP